MIQEFLSLILGAALTTKVVVDRVEFDRQSREQAALNEMILRVGHYQLRSSPTLFAIEMARERLIRRDKREQEQERIRNKSLSRKPEE